MAPSPEDWELDHFSDAEATGFEAEKLAALLTLEAFDLLWESTLEDWGGWGTREARAAGLGGLDAEWLAGGIGAVCLKL